MNQNPKDNSKVLCYWDQDQPGGEATAICIYKQDGFYFDDTLQISPTWWEYLDEFDTPNDAKLRSIIRDLRDELRRRENSKINRNQHCAECDRLARELARWKPKPMSEAPKDGTPFWAVYEHGCGELTITRVIARADGVIFGGYPKMEIPMGMDFICWIPIPTAEELKQIAEDKEDNA